jgi:hypothetical protein
MTGTIAYLPVHTSRPQHAKVMTPCYVLGTLGIRINMENTMLGMSCLPREQTKK